MNYVRYLTGNHVLNVAIFAWAVAQILKLVIVLILERRIDWSRLTGAGGMPSSHSAVVLALAISVGRTLGYYSVEFAMAAVFAFVVIYDASGVRRAAGEHARILNYMMDSWPLPDDMKKDLKEFLGHTPVEVIVGAMLGALVGFLA